MEEDRQEIAKLGRRAGTAHRVHTWICRRPITTIQAIAQGLNVSEPTTIRCLHELTRLGLVRETTGLRRNRRYRYERYLAALNEGTQQPA
ncbi:MAG TPA: helix-turn-helix domain-containing protein [Terriglobales bacterium]|nr:helix-turn-helix domain-containing protein [Terriglobales bacterium]